MKTQSIALRAGEHASRTRRLLNGIRLVDSLPSLAFLVVVSALPPVALVALTTWASNAPSALPALQAAVGLSGLVFLALALDANRRFVLPLLASAAAMFGLAYLGTALSAEILVIGSMVAAAWLGAGLFSTIKTRCL